MNRLLLTKAKFRIGRYLTPGVAVMAMVFLVNQNFLTSRGEEHKTADDKDKLFIKHAAEGGLMEVEIGQVAKRKAENEKLKRLADRLVEDHSKANKELVGFAEAKGVIIPKELSEKHREKVRELSEKSGNEFDRAFTLHSLKHHREDIKKFEKAAQECEDAALKAFAKKSLPILREHYRMAQAAAVELGIEEPAAPGLDSGASADPETKTRTELSTDPVPANRNPSVLPAPREPDLSARSAQRAAETDDSFLGIPTVPGDGETLGVATVPGDGKTLGLNTDKNDGTYLGVIPVPRAFQKTDAGNLTAEPALSTETSQRAAAATAQTDRRETVAAGGAADAVATGAGTGTGGTGTEPTFSVHYKISLDQAPEPVRKALRSLATDEEMKELQRAIVYAVPVQRDGKTLMLLFDDEGKIYRHDSAEQ